jgi:uncharacterized protein (DUF952 family)/nucleoside 2-deoxyribosyltransferase
MTAARVYVASPLGFSDPGTRYLDEVLHPALVTAGFVVVDPWADPGGTTAATLAIGPDDPGRRAALAALNTRLAARNAADIASCDAVLAVLDGSDVDSGTAAEIGFAAAAKRPVIGLRTDIRESGDNEAAVVNLQLLYFIESSGGQLTRTVPDAVRALGAATATARRAGEPRAASGPGDDSRFVFHLTFRADWKVAVRAGEYRLSTRGASLEEVGFIHASFAHQLAATAQLFFSDVDADELVVLKIDRTLLKVPVVVEPSPSSGELFPHLYGPLDPGAVTALLPPP